MDEAVHTEIFAHLDQVMTAEARQRVDGWELAIRDGDGQVRCAWQPDLALVAGGADEMVPTLLQMMISMVRDGLMAPQRDSLSAAARDRTPDGNQSNAPGVQS
ncbi:hypothetical protein [Roseomonas indoligenes]|uniref:Uncharacterized protein n=1 Tax=Roseomonas indoligenes TaxID=2820811 RepID=A0A940S8C4_9PROT|nr:hypothetical protein [Pararoseomonas indoligenes]MBP0495775.1 hypothetical protein [Pararoseomonas indoligenes]